MDLCYEPCLSGWPASCPSSHLSCMARNFNVGNYMHTFQPMLFIPAILIGTVDIYYFIPLSMALTFLGSHKVSAKQNLLDLLYFTLFK